MVQIADMKSGLRIKPSISKTLNGSVGHNIYSLYKREATVDDVLDPCSGARKAFLAGAKPSYTARGDASGKDKGHY